MASEDEIAEMRVVNTRLKAEDIILRAMSDAFDLIFGPADPLTDIDPPPAAAEQPKPAELPACVSPHG